MEDKSIIELFNNRNETAIRASEEKYGNYCFRIANNILGNKEDSEECINETWYTAWNLIPPQEPKILKAFFGKITRNIAINLYHKNNSQKRGSGQYSLVLDELSECITDNRKIDEHLQEIELIEYINKFLNNLPKQTKVIFVMRYYSMDTIESIAKRTSLKPNHVRSVLSRTRSKLKKHLRKVYYCG